MPKKMRVDYLLVERGLAESEELAQRLVMAGQVRAAGQVVAKPSSQVDANVELTVDHGPRFVSRGGEKLEAAFEIFDLKVANQVCADVGASTGGFTDCLLQHGAAKVYAIDVGQGILHWNLRNDSRVVVMESTNARFVETLPEPIDFATIDASFISLKILLPVVKAWFSLTLNPSPITEELGVRELGQVLTLIKPQFEAGRKEVARGRGVVRDSEVHARVLLDVLTFAQRDGYQIKGLARSPVLGPKGNVEFLGWLAFSGEGEPPEISVVELVSGVTSPPEGG
ncbi:MAG TPA: TlyA family rRNA (cytidine-2'-O)-methyltransferase [Chloroflexi bacterium]|nr:TlyA family rRNA (cytidine-2'-O)-methyltransferase [Chloroflexota bacterium]HBY08827.1 TlyA family rRNA (cytidine-2'-O)-methyltransferase [Chloroflexota bacterium]